MVEGNHHQKIGFPRHVGATIAQAKDNTGVTTVQCHGATRSVQVVTQVPTQNTMPCMDRLRISALSRSLCRTMTMMRWLIT